MDRGSGADSILSDSSGIAFTGLVADRENNEVTLSFKVEETENLKQGTWSTVQGGDISLKVALEPGNKFMRIALGE